MLVKECGADVHAADNAGSTAVMRAAINGHKDTVHVLVKDCGADVDAADNDGSTAVMAAAENGHKDTVHVLVKEFGADVNAADKQGNTALMIALRFGHLNTASCLVTELAADSTAANWVGASCLHIAASLTSPSGTGEEEEDQDDKAMKVAELLIGRGGVDLVSKTDSNFGWTPLHYALYVGNEALARMLAERMCQGDASEISEQLERARQHVLDEQRRGPLALWRGLPCDAKLGADKGVVEFCKFSTLRSAQRCPLGGKGYYELEILACDECPQYGFAAPAFQRVPEVSHDGVGDDGHSWAVDGTRQLKWHNGENETYCCTWKVGDVIGLACDLNTMQMNVSVNGSFAAPNGVVFELDPDAAGDGLFAALTGSNGKVRYNLGEAPFKHAPPATDYQAFAAFEA